MKYFRSYPLILQLFLFLMMFFTFLSATGVIILSLLTKITGFTPAQIIGVGPGSPYPLVNAAIIVAGIGNLFNFCIPALLFAYLSTPRPKEYLGLRKPGKNIHFLLAVLIIIGATPVLQMLEGLISQIDFGAKVKASQKANDDMFTAFLNMPDLAAFFKVFVIMAILPGIGEELFFRGILMRFAKKRSRNMFFPILFTSIVFAYSHTNIYGFVSIFFAGVLLGVIYNLTGSILCGMLAHISFNGLQIFLAYLGNNNVKVKAFMTNNTVPYYLVIGGAIVFGASLYLLWKNRTPLPPDWTEDFTAAELSQKAY